MEYEIIVSLRLFLAAFLGGIIGLERESLNKSAGFRTHILVSLGSCLIMLTSIDIFERVGHGVVGDPARIAAQVVSGIGFLGAGTILRSGFEVKGLTTAASLWVVAGIGLAVGIGNYFASVVATVIVFLILVYMPRIEAKLRHSDSKIMKIEIKMLDKPGQLGLVTSVLGNFSVDIRNVEINEEREKDYIKVLFMTNVPSGIKESEILENINNIEGVNQIVLS
ncbi:MAG: MgtC/SapB family protein [Clostridia bacterium]|nr:MgtC/SapB family protein [Clostridia bacterium]MDD4047480.1 MgtC/SapB family protein [Clostridia bacterium]